MEQENAKVEATGGSEKEVMPPPPRKRGRQQKILLIGLAGLVVLATVIFYYCRFVAPYESTDDAFIDGYVTLVSSRVPGQVEKLQVVDNQEVKAGDVLVEIDPRDYAASLAQARADLAVGHGQIRAGLGQAGRVIARIDFHQHIAGLDLLIVHHLKLFDLSRHAGTHQGDITVNEGIIGGFVGRDETAIIENHRGEDHQPRQTNEKNFLLASPFTRRGRHDFLFRTTCRFHFGVFLLHNFSRRSFSTTTPWQPGNHTLSGNEHDRVSRRATPFALPGFDNAFQSEPFTIPSSFPQVLRMRSSSTPCSGRGRGSRNFVTVPMDFGHAREKPTAVFVPY